MTMTTVQTGTQRDYYWANAPTTELPDVVRERCRAFWARLERDGRIDLWRRLERTFYGWDGDGGWSNSTAVTFGGEDGESVMLRVNQFRSIVRAIAALVTAERPAFTAQALQNDGASLDAAPLCEGLVTSYYETRGVEDKADTTARVVCLLGEAFTHLRWDAFIGKPTGEKERPVYRHGQPVTRTEDREVIDPVTGEASVTVEEVPEMETFVVREGDIAPESLTPLQVVRDLDDTSAEPRWAIVAHTANVWDLAARYPELRERIMDARGSLMWPRRVWDQGPDEMRPDMLSSDLVTMWCVYHLATDAVPQGRYALVCGDVVLYDGPFTMRMLPVIPLIPEYEHDTASGDAPVADLLCLQEVYDMAWSALLTPIDALGVQNVLVPDGQDISVEQLGRAMQVLKYQPMPNMPNGGAPTPLMLLRTPEELWKLIELIPQCMERISGINSVTRGAPDSNIKAGNFAALISAQAQQFNGPLARGVLRHHEQIGTCILETLRTYATSTRIAEIGGHGRPTAVKEFKASDLAIDRVSLDMANPLTRQMAGRMEVAQMLLSQPGMIRTPEQFLQFLSSGRIDPMYQSDVSRLTCIKRENEMMSDGQTPPVLITDRHDLHITEHLAVLDDPDIRQRRPDVIKATMAHIEEHIAWAPQVPQVLALLTGQKIAPEQFAGPMAPQAPPSPGAMPRQADAPPQREPGRAQVPGATPSDALPMMPTNPQTGERAAPAGVPA